MNDRKTDVQVVARKNLPLGSGLMPASVCALLVDRIIGGIPWWGFAACFAVWLVWFANACTFRREIPVDIFRHKE